MKILQVYYEPLPSGQTTHVLSLSKGLTLRGHDVTVVLPSLLEGLSSTYLDAEVKVITLPMHKLLWPRQSLIAFLSLIRQGEYEIVHVHSQEAGTVARWLAWLGKAKKVFYTPQTIDIRLSQWHNLYILLERLLAHTTHRIFSVNQKDASRLIGWGIPAEKVSVVPNGIDLSQFVNLEDRVDICQRLCLDPARPVIMQIGRLSSQKDPEMFLKGARHVLSNVSQAQLAWIGEGPLFMQIESEIKSLGLQESIRLLGRIDQAYRCISAADAVTLTSRWEGMPYSLLEAMACSKPVVATAVNGCPEMVIDGHTGYLVDVNDAYGWAQSILRLITDPQQAHFMGVAGKCLVEEKFSLSRMLSQIEQAYLNN